MCVSLVNLIAKRCRSIRERDYLNIICRVKSHCCKLQVDPFQGKMQKLVWMKNKVVPFSFTSLRKMYRITQGGKRSVEITPITGKLSRKENGLLAYNVKKNQLVDFRKRKGLRKFIDFWGACSYDKRTFHQVAVSLLFLKYKYLGVPSNRNDPKSAKLPTLLLDSSKNPVVDVFGNQIFTDPTWTAPINFRQLRSAVRDINEARENIPETIMKKCVWYVANVGNSIFSLVT